MGDIADGIPLCHWLPVAVQAIGEKAGGIPLCQWLAIDSPCECEHNNPDSLDAQLFFTVVLAVAPAVTMDEASSLSLAR